MVTRPTRGAAFREMAMAVQVDLDDQRLVACTSRATDPALAVAELAVAIGSVRLAGALLFCSNGYPRDALARELASQLPSVPCLGVPVQENWPTVAMIPTASY